MTRTHRPQPLETEAQRRPVFPITPASSAIFLGWGPKF